MIVHECCRVEMDSLPFGSFMAQGLTTLESNYTTIMMLPSTCGAALCCRQYDIIFLLFPVFLLHAQNGANQQKVGGIFIHHWMLEDAEGHDAEA